VHTSCAITQASPRRETFRFPSDVIGERSGSPSSGHGVARAVAVHRGDDWTDFLAFYLLVSILSLGISVRASQPGDRSLSGPEETRRLTRAPFLGHTSGAHGSRYLAARSRDASADCARSCTRVHSYVTNTGSTGGG
jgi:hypothetical protein